MAGGQTIGRSGLRPLRTTHVPRPSVPCDRPGAALHLPPRARRPAPADARPEAASAPPPYFRQRSAKRASVVRPCRWKRKPLSVAQAREPCRTWSSPRGSGPSAFLRSQRANRPPSLLHAQRTRPRDAGAEMWNERATTQMLPVPKNHAPTTRRSDLGSSKTPVARSHQGVADDHEGALGDVGPPAFRGRGGWLVPAPGGRSNNLGPPSRGPCRSRTSGSPTDARRSAARSPRPPPSRWPTP